MRGNKHINTRVHFSVDIFFTYIFLLQLLQMLKFYARFEISDETGDPMMDRDMTLQHYSRITSLQVNNYLDVKYNFEEITPTILAISKIFHLSYFVSLIIILLNYHQTFKFIAVLFYTGCSDIFLEIVLNRFISDWTLLQYPPGVIPLN